MKRVIICLSIIAIIIAVGAFTIRSVSINNDRLYGHIDAVISAYESDGDVPSEIEKLRDFFLNDYMPKLGCVINDDLLGELWTGISRLEPMYDSGCDEFTAECESLRSGAKKIYYDELPAFFRIL